MRVLLVFCFSFIALTATPKNKPKFQPNAKSLMRQVLNHYVQLVPYMYDNKKVTTNNEKDQISYHVNGMKSAFKKAHSTDKLKGLGFYPGLTVMQEALEEVSDVQAIDDFHYARFQMRHLAATCVNCHSQLPKSVYPKISAVDTKKLEKQVGSRYQFAMTQFMLRDYKGAIKTFTEVIDTQMQRESYRDIVENSFTQILLIYTKVLEDPKAAREFFTPYMNKKYKYSAINEMLKTWVKDLQTWEVILKKKPSLDKLMLTYLAPNEEMIMEDMSTDKLVGMFFLSGMMSRELFSENKTDKAAEMLYWLGGIESHRHGLFQYSLSELYFQECMQKFSKNPVAKKCYKAYEDHMVMGYTGSSGTTIPEDVKKKLASYKKLVN